MEPMGITRYRLSKDIDVPPQRIGDIVAGKRAITADTDLRLCRYFSLTDGYWLRGQARYDTECARDALHEDLRSEEHTSELQSLMRISYAVFCLKKKNTHK